MKVEVWVEVPDGRTIPAGELSDRVSTTGTFFGSTFQYARSYLTDRSRYALCPELTLGAGPIAATGQRPLAGVFADAQPDRWGRNLLFAAERRAAKVENRKLRKPTDVVRTDELELAAGAGSAARTGSVAACRSSGSGSRPSSPQFWGHWAPSRQ